MTSRIIKLISNENYLELLNQSADSIHNSVLHEKWYLKENMVGTTIAKDQIPDIRWTYTKGIINLREAFNDKIYIVSMGMNTKFKVDSHFFNA